MSTTEQPKSSEPQKQQSQTADAGTTTAEQSPLAQLAALLKAEKEEGAPQGAPQGEKPKGKPKTMAELAVTLGVEPAELYGIQVPSAQEGAEPYTLGKLKDLAAEHDDFTLRSLRLEDDARKRQSEFMRAEAELQEILATLPPDAIKPEARAKLEAKRNRALVSERQRVLEVIPEWKDATVRTQEIESMVEHLKDYGFPETYLSSVFDHRTLRYIRANWQREQQIRKALERVQEKKPTTPPKSKAPAAQKPASRRNGMVPVEEQQAHKFGELILKAANKG